MCQETSNTIANKNQQQWSRNDKKVYKQLLLYRKRNTEQHDHHQKGKRSAPTYRLEKIKLNIIIFGRSLDHIYMYIPMIYMHVKDAF